MGLGLAIAWHHGGDVVLTNLARGLSARPTLSAAEAAVPARSVADQDPSSSPLLLAPAAQR
ncbi:hypothetical protein ABLE93_10265 [Xanthobacter sp. KR7-65]|uniref:hypothetical protein n=1 Tax=Xanthobacter sp. KR7-65 TaxID=3156612 RepID=UPI0032B49ACA